MTAVHTPPTDPCPLDSTSGPEQGTVRNAASSPKLLIDLLEGYFAAVSLAAWCQGLMPAESCNTTSFSTMRPAIVALIRRPFADVSSKP